MLSCGDGGFRDPVYQCECVRGFQGCAQFLINDTQIRPDRVRLSLGPFETIELSYFGKIINACQVQLFLRLGVHEVKGVLQGFRHSRMKHHMN